MQTAASLFESELEKLIKTRITHLKDDMSTGSAEDFVMYKRMAGQIEGLVAALELFPDARKNAEQRNR